MKEDGYEYFQVITENGIKDLPFSEDVNNTIVTEVALKERHPRKVYPAKDNHIYSYDGPIYQFNKCVILKFKAETMAVSEAKAAQNIIYRAKKMLNLSPSAGGFKLGNSLKLVE